MMSSPLTNHSEPRYLNSQSHHCRLDEMCVCVWNCNEISGIFIFLFCKDFYITCVLISVITLFGDEIQLHEKIIK